MKNLLLLVVFTVCCHFMASAQNCDTDFLGTKTLYNPGKPKYTPPPAGYSPVFINHVGRHGARHLTKDVKQTTAYTLLFHADSLGALTEQGKRLLRMVIALQKVEQGNIKSISVRGKEELSGIAKRLFVNYSNAFTARPNLTIAYTKEIRTRQSANAFLKGLNAKLTDTATVNWYNDDTDLRFYDISAAYKKFEDSVDNSRLKLSFEKKENIDVLDDSITARIFDPEFAKKLNIAVKEKFAADVFGFATIMASIQDEVKEAGYKPADVDIKSFFTCTELEKLAAVDNADNFLKKGPGVNKEGIQVRIAVPLLIDFINTTDDFIENGKYNARLRFTHAEAIAPFAALLQISGADREVKDLTNLHNVWKSSKIIPLSSNIEWILYKSTSNKETLVKILFNEQEVHITGLNDNLFPYYKWSELRLLYMNRLNKFDVKLNANMNQYLNNIQY